MLCVWLAPSASSRSRIGPTPWRSNSNSSGDSAKCIATGTRWAAESAATAFACGSMQGQFMKGRVALIGCPKLDDNDAYVQKLTDIISTNPIKDITLVHMEVPCCSKLPMLVRKAMSLSGKTIPLEEVVISRKGAILQKQAVAQRG